MILTLKSGKDIRSPRIERREQVSTNRWHVEIRLAKPSDVDRQLTSWLSSAYALASGDNPDAALAQSLSGERMVTSDTPPTFLFHTNADTSVPAENSVHYYLALRKAGVAAEMHIFEKGAHGVGLANNDAALSEWSRLLANWLRVRGVIK